MKTLNKKVVKDLNNIISDIVTKLLSNTELLNLFLEEANNYFIKENYSYTQEELKKLFYHELKNEKLRNNRFIFCLAIVYYKMRTKSQNVTLLSLLTIPSEFYLELLNIFNGVRGANYIFGNYVIMYSIFFYFKIICSCNYTSSQLLEIYNAFSPDIKDKTKFLEMIDFL